MGNWVVCPEEVLCNKSLSPVDLRVYLYMKFRHDYLALQGKEYFESYSKMQEAIGVSERSIVRSVKILQEEQLIKVVRRSRQTSLITVLL